jgi:hypothetical protein
MDFANGRNLGVRLRLIACAIGRRCLLVAAGDFEYADDPQEWNGSL